jgi:hypothetical protein
MGKTVKYLKNDLYETLDEEYGVFESSYDILVFLAVLGYREGSPVRSDYRGGGDGQMQGEIGLENLYNNELYRAVMASLAFQDTGNPEALVDSSTQTRVLVQYAAGGLEVAESEFGDVAGDPTDAFVNYLKGYEEDGTDVEGELQTIIQAFDEGMMES